MNQADGLTFGLGRCLADAVDGDAVKGPAAPLDRMDNPIDGQQSMRPTTGPWSGVDVRHPSPGCVLARFGPGLLPGTALWALALYLPLSGH